MSFTKIGTLQAYHKTIEFDTLTIVKIDKPTSSGYTYALIADSGETVGFLKPVSAKGDYRIDLYNPYEVKNGIINLPSEFPEGSKL